MQTETIPQNWATMSGYWQDANGNLVPESKVKDIDKLRDQVVRELCTAAIAQQQGLRKFKLDAMQEVAALITTSMEQYGVKTGGDKGNVTLFSFDGKYKVQRQMADHIAFGEQLQAAKALIDQCVTRWSQGANANLQTIVLDAFQVDKEGKINTGRVLGLRRLKIDEPEWLQAMQAIGDSVRVNSTKPYIRFYVRDEHGVYQPIALDLAAV